MRVAVLGAGGMLGFAIHDRLTRDGHKVTGIVRSVPQKGHSKELHPIRHYVSGVDVEREIGSLWKALNETSPDIVINAVGVKPSAPMGSQLTVNALLPKLLADRALLGAFRLIHFSTDAVFDGSAGAYKETDEVSPSGDYGVTKYLGEVRDERSTTIRTSMVGLSLKSHGSLINWLLAQTGDVPGYPNVWFSGLSVVEIANVVSTHMLPRMDELGGLWHLAGDPISKMDLLSLVRDQWRRRDIYIVPDETKVLDRSLDGSRLNRVLDYRPPPWSDQIRELYAYGKAFMDGCEPFSSSK
jgi:dTDP-4-dehydrorhamnose reductase